MRENAMIMERLVDSLLASIIKSDFNVTDGDIKDSVLKHGYDRYITENELEFDLYPDEDEGIRDFALKHGYSGNITIYELKYDLNFDDDDAVRVFHNAWSKLTTSIMAEVKNFDLGKTNISEKQWESLWSKNGGSFEFPLDFGQPSEIDQSLTRTGIYRWNTKDTDEFNRLMIIAKVAKSLGCLEGSLVKAKELKLYQQGIEWAWLAFSI